MNDETKYIWVRGLSNEWGQLAQGNIHGVRSSDTIKFIYRSKAPHNREVTHATFVLDYRPIKDESHRVCITV